MELNELISNIEELSEYMEMPLDTDIYDKCGKPYNKPILYAGSLDSDVCFLARDLGKDEVFKGQPLIGSAGQLLRRSLYKLISDSKAPEHEIYFPKVMERVLFTNMVPYKPKGNRVFPKKIRKAFAPYIAELLINHWKGNYLITLGTEAFKWFEFFTDKDSVKTYWSDEDNRYKDIFECEITCENGRKKLMVAPLPHPSPLNVKWYRKFPELLLERLKTKFK